MGRYYGAGEERARRVEDLFSRIAPRYDLINDLQSAGLHRIWKRRLVGLADVPDGGRVLDLCCGTGDIVRQLARAYPRASLIVGLDFALPMLRRAASALTGREADHDASGEPESSRAAPSLGFVQGDALRIPAEDASFDRVTVAYGLRNVSDLHACLAEVRRVLRPRGRFLTLEFGKPPSPLLSRLYFGYLRTTVPLFGRIFFGDRDTYGYIHDSLVAYPGQEEVAEMLRRSGFATVRVMNPLFGMMGIHVADI